MSNRKEGFTLIELLAVIVVLAIIALIATPIILNVVEKAKVSAFKNSVMNGYNAIELSLLESNLSDIPKGGIGVKKLKLKSDFKSGKYKKDLYGNVIAENITNGEYCANGDVKNLTITKGNCSDLLVLPEDRMRDSYIDEELYNRYSDLEIQLMFIEKENPDVDLTTNDIYIEFERLSNLLDEQFKQQKSYFFTNDLMTINEDNEIVLPTVENVTTLKTNEVPANVITSKDISHKQDGKVMVWFLDEDNDTELEMYIGQDGGVIAPRNSIFLFSEFGKKYDLSNFNTSNVTNMSGMFVRCNELTSLDLSNFDTSNVTNMSGMFTICDNLVNLNLSNFNTSNVTNMSFMFSNCLNLTSLDLSSFDTSNVTNMYGMFVECRNLTSLDLSNFNTSNVTNMMGMFAECRNLTTIYKGSKWVTAPTADDMFTGCGTSTLTLK